MSPNPSFTLDVETATAFRDWLFETGVDSALMQGGLTALPVVPDELTLTAIIIGLVLVGLNIMLLAIVTLLPAFALYRINQLAA